MAFDRDLLSDINRTAHMLAQQQYAAYRSALLVECRKMMSARKSRGEIAAYLANVVARGEIDEQYAQACAGAREDTLQKKT